MQRIALTPPPPRKNNWVLVALILVAFLGFIIMLALLSAPCTPHTVVVERRLKSLVNQTLSEVEITCFQTDASTGKSKDAGIKACPVDASLKPQVQCLPVQELTRVCSNKTCIAYEDPEDTAGLCKTAVENCNVTAVLPCVTKLMCTTSAGVKTDQECNPVLQCTNPYTKEVTVQFPDAQGNTPSCPAVPTCTFCEKAAASGTGVTRSNPIDEKGTCEAGSTTPMAKTEAADAAGICPGIGGQADFDGQILLDGSGSMGAAFKDECLVAKLAVEQFGQDLGNTAGAPFQIGTNVWNTQVVKAFPDGGDSGTNPGVTTNYLSVCLNADLKTE
jgi:hypothetical protein